MEEEEAADSTSESMSIPSPDVQPPVVSTPSSDGIIRKLDEVVINRIAAGEVVQRPANALKEILENSLDAGAKSIQIVVKAGGLKLLQIQDDGSGIKKEDLTIVCERFTTSKLECFEDLQRIETYGFRGEALASISHVAHVTIITKTADSQCAYRAEYTNGELKPAEPGSSNPKACAGNVGTIIMAEDLFYNMDTRRRALKSTSDEHNKIVDVVTKYAVHNCRVGLSLKKFGETTNDVRVPPNSSHLDNIKMLYGVQIARELVPVSAEDNVTKFSVTGYVSNANYSVKKANTLLFINNRLVDSLPLRRAVDSVYAAYLPKGSHPFLYLSIKIDPRNVDVNVHPTKHEVHFLHEEMIVNSIVNSIENALLTTNKSRTFYVQSLLPNANATVTSSKPGRGISRKSTESLRASIDNPPKTDQRKQSSDGADSSAVAAKNMRRTDPREQKLDKFLSATPSTSFNAPAAFQDGQSSAFGLPAAQNVGTSIQPNADRGSSLVDDNLDCTIVEQRKRGNQSLNETPGESTKNSSQLSQASNNNQSGKRREIRLRSIKNLMKNVDNDCHNGLLELFRNHVFVGCVDRTLALIQHDTKLCMINTIRLSTELFYQKILQEFGNLGRITFDDPIFIRELVRSAFDSTEPGQIIDGLNEEDMANFTSVEDEVHRILTGKSKMLDDYFSMKIDEEGRLCSIPMLLENYVPVIEEIPLYLIHLARRVNWTSEEECFQTFSHETALFYGIRPGTMEDNDQLTMNNRSWKWTIEHVLYPEIKKSLLPPKIFAEDSTVVQLANLPDLYKVFERC